MESLWQTIQTMIWNVFHRPGLSDIIDIIIVAFIVYELIMLTRQTRGSAVLKGLVLLLLIVGISDLLGLTALNWLLMTIVSNGAVVLVILFQPELRKALEQMGRGTVLDKNHEDKSEEARIVDEVIRCLTNLSRRRVGALIVFEQKTGLQDVIETGISIDAQISSALLENICTKDTLLYIGIDTVVILCDIVRDEHEIFRIVEAGQLSSAQNIRMLLTAQGERWQEDITLLFCRWSLYKYIGSIPPKEACDLRRLESAGKGTAVTTVGLVLLVAHFCTLQECEAFRRATIPQPISA